MVAPSASTNAWPATSGAGWTTSSGSTSPTRSGPSILTASATISWPCARAAGASSPSRAGDIDADGAVISIVVNARAAICEPFWIEHSGLHVGATLGLAMAPFDGVDADTLARKADVALARAKRLGVDWA